MENHFHCFDLFAGSSCCCWYMLLLEGMCKTENGIMCPYAKIINMYPYEKLKSIISMQ